MKKRFHKVGVLLELTTSMPLRELRDTIRACLEGEPEIVVDQVTPSRFQPVVQPEEPEVKKP